MNKLIIGLLIIAAGAGIFLYLQKKDNPETTVRMQQKQILGDWKIDSMHVRNDSNTRLLAGTTRWVDSNSIHYQYRFKKDGSILHLLGDSSTKDTSFYALKKVNELTWREDRLDTTGSKLTIAKLTQDTLLLLTTDSIQVLFTKTR